MATSLFNFQQEPMSRYSGDGVSPLMQQLGASGGVYVGTGLMCISSRVPEKLLQLSGSCVRGVAGNGLEKVLQVRFTLAVGKAKA